MTSERTKKGFVVLMSALTALVIFALGFGFGNRNLQLRDGVIPTVVNTEIGKPADVDFSLFWEAFQAVENEFAGSDVDRTKLLYGAVRGMVASLNDPYSLFLDPTEQQEFFQSLNGRFSGIGAEIGERDDKFVVIAPLDDSPALGAGLKAGDEIIAVDGEEVGDLTLNDVVNKIRGEKGTQVVLGIVPDGTTELKEITITRDTIKVDSVKHELRDDKVGVIRIRQFGDETAADVLAAARALKDQGVAGIVVDLRSNPGGYLDGAVKIASLWIEDGPIVSEQYRDGQRDTYDAEGDAILKNVPTAVLIDKGSASASEIVAGALQDTGKARLFGSKSFGKGSVQDVKELKDNAALRLTVATWLTPKDRNINHEGITPDEQVESPADSATTDTEKVDTVLNRAVEWLQTQ